MTLRVVGVRLTAEIGEYQAKLRAAAQATRDFKGELDRASKKGNLDHVANQAAVVGVGLLGLAAGAVKMNADFEKAMSGVAAATHAPTAEIDRLRKAAIKAGQDTQYSATAAAEGITELSKAGVKTADILGGGLKGALALAAAGQISVGEAAQTAASAMTQFRLQGTAVPHVADLLAAAAGKAQGSVHDMGYALNQSGLVASQFGLSVEDTTGALAEFASAGLIGSDAGTSFKTMLLAMANPSDVTSRLMTKMGISFYDTQGKFLGLSGVADMLRQQLGGLTDEQRQGTLAQIFGNDAVRAASILYTDGAKGVETWKNKVNDSGYAATTAAKLTDNLAGDLERLKGSLETVAIQSGGGATSGLRSLTQSANGAVNAFSSLPGWVQESVTVLSGVGGASLLAAAGFLKARSTAKDFLDELRDMGPRGAAAAGGLSKIGSVAGRLGLVGVAAVGVYEGMKLFGDWVDHFSAPTARDVDKMTDALTQFASSGRLTGELAKTFGSDMSGLTRDLDGIRQAQTELAKLQATANGPGGKLGEGRALAALGGQIKQLRAQADTDLGALDDSLAHLVSSGSVTAAKIAFDRLAEATGLSLAQLPKYAAASKAAASASTGLASGFGDASANARTMTGALQQAVEAGQKLTDVWKQLHGAVLGSDKAMLDAQQAIDAVKTSFKENKRAIDGNSESALKNRVAVGEAAEAAAKAAQAKYEETGSVQKASATYDGYIDQLKKTLHQGHLTDGQINTLISTYAKMPSAVTTRLSVTNYDNVKNQLVRLAEYQKALKSGKDPGSISLQGTGGKMRFATGGFVPGSSPSKTADNIPAMLTAGEWVQPVDAVDYYGPGFMAAVQQRRIPREAVAGYAGGGQVWPFPVTAAKTKIPSKTDVMNAVLPAGGGPGFGHWPSSPSAQRGDSGVWRSVVALIKSTGPISGHFGNAYRPGDPLWHGSGRAVDWMGFNQDALATFLASKGPLELIHRTKNRDYAYTRGVNKGSFRESLMEAHRNHVHIAMANGGVIPEHVIGVGRSGRTYEFGERGPETVIPGYARGGLVNVAPGATSSATRASRLDTADALLSAASAVAQLTAALKANGRSWSFATQKGRDNRSALISGIRAAQDAAKAKYAETGSVRAANRVYDEYLHKLDESMKKMHVNAKTRRDLLRAYSERPKYDLPAAAAPTNSGDLIKATQDHIGIEDSMQTLRGAFAWQKPTFNLKTETGRSELNTLFGFLNAASAGAQSMFEYTGNAKQATAYYRGYLSQLRATLIKSGMSAKDADALIRRYGRITLTPKANRWGGVYEHAAGGALSEAMTAPGGPTRYAWAESSTGGELFAPKNGNLQKTRREVGWAVANWWGGRVDWSGHGGARNVTVQATIPITLGTETITRQVEFVVDTAIGKVATAVIHQAA